MSWTNPPGEPAPTGKTADHHRNRSEVAESGVMRLGPFAAVYQEFFSPRTTDRATAGYLMLRQPEFKVQPENLFNEGLRTATEAGRRASNSAAEGLYHLEVALSVPSGV